MASCAMENESRRGYHESWCSLVCSSDADFGRSRAYTPGGGVTSLGGSQICEGDRGSETDERGVSVNAVSSPYLATTVSCTSETQYLFSMSSASILHPYQIRYLSS